jgi:hypothetical protein
MILIKHLIASALLLAGFSYLHAEEPQPKTTWGNDSETITKGSRYVFGLIISPPNFFNEMSGASEDSNDDPFSPSPKQTTTKVMDIYPIVKTQNLPLCLPSHPSYRDVSKLLSNNGIIIKAPEWALLSTGLAGYRKLYFCTTSANTDLLKQAFSYVCAGGPRHSLMMRTTVVSLENQGMDSKAWTINNLNQEKPHIHARFASLTRSGERSSIILKSNASKTQGEAEYELTLGENKLFYDARISIQCQLPGNIPIHLSQLTAYTGQVETPFIIDCGTHGEDRRNYFLIMDTNLVIQPYSYIGRAILKRLDQIDGIYAMRKSTDKKTTINTQAPLETKVYRCEANAFHHLKWANDRNPLPPIQLKDIKESPHSKASDQIFDITPALRHYELKLDDKEWIHINTSQNKIIVYGTPHTQESVVSTISRISPNILVLRVNARIISVKNKGRENSSWTMDQIEKSNPELLTMYSSTGRSGEKSISGKLMHTYTTKDNKTNKEVTHNEYEFETESTIGESNQTIDLRLAIHSKPLGKQQITTKVVTAITLNDGKPTIIELGHPNSATHTHLLIINPDIITIDGTFYRDRFKPIKP